MKTIREREINVRTIIYNLINFYQPYPKLITEHKEAIDQALKELEELLVECKPESKSEDNTDCKFPDHPNNVKCLQVHIPPIRASKLPENIGYNQALDDYEKNIKKAIGGK